MNPEGNNDKTARKHYLWGLLIAALIFLLYLPTLDTFLMGDDFEWLDSAYRGWQDPGTLVELINNFFRPFIKLSYLLNYTLFKTDVVFYNLFTVLLHLGNVFLLYILVWKISKRILFASLTALLYGVSAMYSEVTLWAAGRPDAIMMLFLLGSLTLLVRDEGTGSGTRKTIALLLAAGAACSKETWVLLPFLAFALVWLVNRRTIKETFKETWQFFLLLALYVGFFVGGPMLLGNAPPTSYGKIDIANIIDKFGFLLFKYVGLRDGFTGTWWQFVLIVAVLGGLAFLFIRRNNRAALYGGAWMLMTIAISLPIYYAPSRYNYVPLMGFWIMVVAFLGDESARAIKRFNIKKSIIIVAAVVLVLFYVVQQGIMLQLEIKDYKVRGSLHKQMVDMYLQVKDEIPVDKPILFLDLGTRKAVHEAIGQVKGYDKLYFIRESAIWQQVYLSPLVNFVGEPFKRLMGPVTRTQQESILKGEFTTLVFTDSGFFIPITDEYTVKTKDHFRKYGQLPKKVQLLWFY